MGWIAGIGALAGGAMSYMSSREASKAAQASARPWSSSLGGIGNVDFSNGSIALNPETQQQVFGQDMFNEAKNQFSQFQGAQANNPFGMNFMQGAFNQAQGAGGMNNWMGAAGMPSTFFGGPQMQQGFQQQAQQAQGLGNSALQQAQGGYGGQSFMNAGQNLLNGPQNLTGNMQTNFDPTQAGNEYTNMLRQSALPQEQQATSNALTGLFNSGRLGTTGGAQQMGQMQQAQQQADLQRQISGRQMGMQEQLQRQQGYDAALNNEQGRQLNQYGAAAQLSGAGAGLFGQAYNNAGLGMGLGQAADQFGFDRQMQTSNTNFERQGQLYTASDTATQDRFNRAMQMFGLGNAQEQQYMGNAQGLLGMQQGQNQQLMDMARIGASVGQSQGAAGAAAAQMRNQGNQDLIAGFMGAANAYASNNKKGG